MVWFGGFGPARWRDRARSRAHLGRAHLGRALRHLPAVEPAWLAGDIGEAQVAVFAAARTPATASAMERDEATLVERARTLRYQQFARAMAYWRQLADEAGAQGGARAQHDARRLQCSQTFGGAWVLDGLLDPVGGATVAEALSRTSGSCSTVPTG